MNKKINRKRILSENDLTQLKNYFTVEKKKTKAKTININEENKEPENEDLVE